MPTVEPPPPAPGPVLDGRRPDPSWKRVRFAEEWSWTLPGVQSLSASASTNSGGTARLDQSTHGSLTVIRQPQFDGTWYLRVQVQDSQVHAGDVLPLRVVDENHSVIVLMMLVQGQGLDAGAVGGSVVQASMTVATQAVWPELRFEGPPMEPRDLRGMSALTVRTSVCVASGECKEGWRLWALTLTDGDPLRDAVRDGLVL